MNGKKAKALRREVKSLTGEKPWEDLRTVRKKHKPDTFDHVGHHPTSGHSVYQRAKRGYNGDR